MSSWRKSSILLLTLLLGVMLTAMPAFAAGPIELFTPYTNLSASPGQTVNYSVEVMNNTEDIQTIGLQVQSVPNDWTYELTSGGWGITELSIKPGESGSVSLKVNIPYAVQKGAYRLSLVSDQGAALPLNINIAEAGTFRTELTTEQPNLEGASDASFTYTVNLNNKTAEEQTYALRHGAPTGWTVQFTSGGQNVSSVVLEPNSSQSLTVKVTPAANATAETYSIPIEASNASTGDKLNLEASITGSYALQLTTPDGRVSTSLTAGGSKTVDLVLTNTGTSELSDIQLSSTTPVDWSVEFDKDETISLAAGESKTVGAVFKSSSKAIAGDYVVGISARSAEVSQSASFRVSVETSVLWGWLGILIIAGVFGGIIYLFRKYGRR
jgi:uncharacterized membrane protein